MLANSLQHHRTMLLCTGLNQSTDIFRVFLATSGWLGSVVATALDSRSIGRRFNSRPVHCWAATLGKLFIPMCLSVQFGTGQGAVMLCGWEGNRRSGVALAMHHRLSGLSTYGLKGQCDGDEHPSYAPLEHGPLYLYISSWDTKPYKKYELSQMRYDSLKSQVLSGWQKSAGISADVLIWKGVPEPSKPGMISYHLPRGWSGLWNMQNSKTQNSKLKQY